MARRTPRRPSQRGVSLGGTSSQTTCEQIPTSSRHKKQSGNTHRPSESSQVCLREPDCTISLLYVGAVSKVCTKCLAVTAS